MATMTKPERDRPARAAAPWTETSAFTRGRRRLVASAARHAVLLACSALFVLPFVWMLATSLKTNQQVVAIPPEWVPNPFSWRNYPDALDAVPFVRYAGNTAFISLVTIVGSVLSNATVAYGFACLTWRGRDALFVVVLASLMLPFQVTVIPLFIVFARLGWTNTYLPLTVPSFFANAFFIFLLRQFFRRIPRDYADAARIEGANELQILWQIMVPLARPALITVALFQFLYSWNDFLGPLIYLNDESLFTLSLGLANMQSNFGLSQFGQIMAASTMIVLPAIIAFTVAQRYFISGISGTGIKG